MKTIVVSRGRLGANVMNVLWLMVLVLLILFSVGLDGWATICERKNGGLA